MNFLLDSNVVIALIRLDQRVVRRLNEHAPDEVSISAISIFELAYGALKSSRAAENLRVLGDVAIEALDVTASDARAAGEIRYQLERAGTPISAYDTLIAGQALARDLTLVTRNTREFLRVDRLRVENWEA